MADSDSNIDEREGKGGVFIWYDKDTKKARCEIRFNEIASEEAALLLVQIEKVKEKILSIFPSIK